MACTAHLVLICPFHAPFPGLAQNQWFKTGSSLKNAVAFMDSLLLHV